jgi:hypothetical protein
MEPFILSAVSGGASHFDGSKSEMGMIEIIGILNVKMTRGKRHTPDAEDGRWPRRVDANSFAREMHEERRAEKKGGEAEVATGCSEFGGATHGELPLSMRRSKQEQRDAGLTHDAGLMADSIRFRRRVWKQDNRPRVCRLGTVGVRAEQKRRTGDAIRRGDPT